MKTKLIAFLIFILSASCAVAQTSFSPYEIHRAILTGPFGDPRAVYGTGVGGGDWSSIIVLYEDDDVEIFIPDITNEGWVYWKTVSQP